MTLFVQLVAIVRVRISLLDVSHWRNRVSLKPCISYRVESTLLTLNQWKSSDCGEFRYLLTRPNFNQGEIEIDYWFY